jgi:glucosamine--fructose-6-phosphate aminotransferase (isomerizing)
MCGIVGAIAQRPVAKILLEGLSRLEYRGYDSAGIALLDKEGTLQRLRTLGKVAVLAEALQKQPINGLCGVAHTRWATHGEPSAKNAHPHVSQNRIAVVHNGIIENHMQLRERLEEEGYRFDSDTDTEVVPHLFDSICKDEKDILKAFQSTVAQLEGAFALGVMHAATPDRMYVARCGSPLVIGLGIHENFFASDVLALSPVTQRFIYLEEGDIAVVSQEEIKIYNQHGNEVKRETEDLSTLSNDEIDRGPYRHFMQKEIFEQPNAIRSTLLDRIGQTISIENCFIGLRSNEVRTLLSQIKAIQIVACGTSYHAGLVARYWLEQYTGLPTQVEIASEFRYRHNVVAPGTLFIAISQSGETADTLAAIKKARQEEYECVLGICNVAESNLVRESDLIFLTRAGREIGVASTKAFSTQLTALLIITAILAEVKGKKNQLTQDIGNQLRQLPQQLERVLELDDTIASVARFFVDKVHTLFLGRGVAFPLALEGALKLKEISYVHAEGYPSGELKHGPLALVDHEMPVIALVFQDELVEKVLSNLHEVTARGGKLIIFADPRVKIADNFAYKVIRLPMELFDLTAPIVMTIPLQLLSYHVAILKGTDVDQPRNLAKSVTVE